MKHAAGLPPPVSYTLPGSGKKTSCHRVQSSSPGREDWITLPFLLHVQKKTPPSQDNLLTQITFHSYLIVLVSHTDKLLARLAEPCKGPPHEFSDSVETCQYPFLYLTKQPQRGKLWCKAHLFRKAAPFASGLP